MQARPVVAAVRYSDGDTRRFPSLRAAAEALKLPEGAVSGVASGQYHSAEGWWFHYDDDPRPVPSAFGTAATRAKRDRPAYGINLETGERRTFRNCTVADFDLALYRGAAASVAAGACTSAAGWAFSHDANASAPTTVKGALVAVARSRPVAAIQEATGREQWFPSAKAAAEALGMNRAAISLALAGKRPSARGYLFRPAAPGETA